jgi:hypothetical protein
MTNTTSTNAQQPAQSAAPRRRQWTKPVLDILELADAQQGRKFAGDGHGGFSSQ